MKKVQKIIKKNYRTLWASTREIYSIYEADDCNTNIITVPHAILKKLNLVGKPLDRYSLETVKMFYDDAKSKRYSLSE